MADKIISYGVSIASNQFNHVKPPIENDNLYQAVVECLGVADDGWLKVKRLEQESKIYLIEPSRFIPTFTPKFLQGETVFVPRKSCNAKVYGLNWHFKQAEYIYKLAFNCKRSSRRYFANELEKIDN